MSDEEKKSPIPFPPIIHDQTIVIRVPPNTSKREIENQIHKALAEQPQDIFLNRLSKEVIIVVQQEQNGPRPK
jgi:hypothetical protein